MRGLCELDLQTFRPAQFDVGEKARGSVTRAVRNGTAMRVEYSLFDFLTVADEWSISLDDSARGLTGPRFLLMWATN